jgi:phosphomannomutase
MNALPNDMKVDDSPPSEGAALKSVRTLMAQSGVPFGTSGVRGPVSAMTDALCFAYTSAFLQYLRSIDEFAPGQPVALAGDLRPSTPRIVQACAAAVRAAGGVLVNCGLVPTPALAYYALGRKMPSIMVTEAIFRLIVTGSNSTGRQARSSSRTRPACSSSGSHPTTAFSMRRARS